MTGNCPIFTGQFSLWVKCLKKLFNGAERRISLKNVILHKRIQNEGGTSKNSVGVEYVYDKNFNDNFEYKLLGFHVLYLQLRIIPAGSC